MAEVGQSIISRRTWEIVIDCYLSPDAIFAYLHLEDAFSFFIILHLIGAFSLIIISYEELFEKVVPLSEAGHGRDEIAIAQLTLHNVCRLDIVCKDFWNLIIIRNNEILSSFPDNLVLEWVLLIRVVNTRHYRRELYIDEI